MLISSIVPARKLQQAYKSVTDQVKSTKKPAIPAAGGEPQAAIVRLEDLEQLKEAKARQAALQMLELAETSKKELKTLPADSRDRANESLYSND
jgi:PHD/YefM family antitoxin component YafN of YafNO toxin-antitoxin module